MIVHAVGAPSAAAPGGAGVEAETEVNGAEPRADLPSSGNAM
jgi:hypothetical protein